MSDQNLEEPSYDQADCEELVEICQELFSFADRMSRAPYHIVQPILGITKRHLSLINKYKLL